MSGKVANKLENNESCDSYISNEYKLNYYQCESSYSDDEEDQNYSSYRFKLRPKINHKSEPDQHQYQQQPHQQYKRKRIDYHLTIQLRNARERNRVRAVNEAFARLRTMIPYTAHRSKRVSKVKTLQKAIQYIAELTELLKTISEKCE